MKYFLLFIFTMIINSAVAQSRDTTCFDNSHVQRIGNHIDSLETVVKFQTSIIDNQNQQIRRYEIVNSQNEVLLQIRSNEVIALNSALEYSLGINQKTTMKEKWYDSKYMYFLYGALTIYGGALVVSMVR